MELKVPPLKFTTPTEPLPPAAMVIKLLLMVSVPALWLNTQSSLLKPITMKLPAVAVPPLISKAP